MFNRALRARRRARFTVAYFPLFTFSLFIFFTSFQIMERLALRRSG
jgi:hypothetical protein